MSYTTETNNAGTRTLIIKDNTSEGGQVTAWLHKADESAIQDMLVGVWTPGECWIAKQDMSGSVRWPGYTQQQFTDLTRLAHLYV